MGLRVSVFGFGSGGPGLEGWAISGLGLALWGVGSELLCQSERGLRLLGFGRFGLFLWEFRVFSVWEFRVEMGWGFR